MYTSSTQKRHWSFSSQSELDEMRAQTNETHIARYKPLIDGKATNSSVAGFLSPREESLFCRIVTEPGIRFGEEFKPPMFPAVRWTAFTYFKRFYLCHSPMEFYPRQMLLACYWLASKTEEFTISIDEFVDNLRQGNPQSNVESILTLEPELMRMLNYELIVHTPYRPFDGQLLDFKMRQLAIAKLLRSESDRKKFKEFEVDSLRPHGMAFLSKALLSDAMFLYAPSQISLATIKYGLQKIFAPQMVEELMHHWLVMFCEVSSATTDDASSRLALRVEKLELLTERICQQIDEQALSVEEQTRTEIKSRIEAMSRLKAELDPALRKLEQEQAATERGNFMVDSDDDTMQ